MKQLHVKFNKLYNIMKNLTDMIKESKTHPTISKSGYFLMVFDAPVTPVKNK